MSTIIKMMMRLDFGLQSLLPLVGMMVAMMTSLAESMSIGSERYEDVSFPKTNRILNNTVTCGDIKPAKFTAPTWTCADVRVNGKRLAYGYYSGWIVGADHKRCHETSGVHEFGELCRLLLQSIYKEKMGLRAVYVPKSSCSFLNDTRKLLKKVAENKFEWRDFRVGSGWTHTIQCMTAA